LLLSGLDVKLGDLNVSFNYYANKEVNEFSEVTDDNTDVLIKFHSC